MDEYGAILIYEKFRYLTIPSFIYLNSPLVSMVYKRTYRFLFQKWEKPIQYSLLYSIGLFFAIAGWVKYSVLGDGIDLRFVNCKDWGGVV